ncbi:MAG: hypothetical protein Fur0037_01120 [Planctomycetota bacterium]
MSLAGPQRRKLVESVLAGGAVPFALILEALLPASELRSLCRDLGKAPKGGFRIEKAPALVLAKALAETRVADEIDRVVGRLLELAGSERTRAQPKKAASEPRDLSREVERLRGEVEHLKRMVERGRAVRARALQREAGLRSRLERAEAEKRLLEVERSRPAPGPASTRRDRKEDAESERRLRDLEEELRGFSVSDAALRRLLAAERTRVRRLEARIAELEPLVPKGRRRKKAPEPIEEERRLRLPYLRPSFYKSLTGKDRRSIERAFQAILLFCTEGHSYPGLEVKQLGGQDTWSLRASLGLRVYFTQRPDGDIDVLELADREDQHTTLRRLKER